MNVRSATATILIGLLATSQTMAAKPPPPPPPPDPCIGVTETTFPSFMFGQTIEMSRNVYGTGIFLADASGKCPANGRHLASAGQRDRQLQVRRPHEAGDDLGAGWLRHRRGVDGDHRFFWCQRSDGFTSRRTLDPVGLSRASTPPDLAAAGWVGYGAANPGCRPAGHSWC